MNQKFTNKFNKMFEGMKFLYLKKNFFDVLNSLKDINDEKIHNVIYNFFKY